MRYSIRGCHASKCWGGSLATQGEAQVDIDGPKRCSRVFKVAEADMDV